MKEFKKGNKVVHKASGEVGVIVFINRQCVNKNHTTLTCIKVPKDCVYELCSYNVEVAFGKVIKNVNPCCLVEPGTIEIK